MARKTHTYRTCVPIPKGTNEDFFVPSGLNDWKLSSREFVTYLVLCGFDGIATVTQINSVVTKVSARTILRSLKKLVELGYVRYEEDVYSNRTNNVVSLTAIKSRKILNKM